MAPGDLNLKKSWNPKLIKNQQKVWEKEQEALQERKKILERQKEIEAEREKLELKRLRQKAKGQTDDGILGDRIDWMYEHGQAGDGLKQSAADATNANSTSEVKNDDKDYYLLGKKRLDDLILKKANGSNSDNGGSQLAKKYNKLESALLVGNPNATSGLLDQRELIKISKDDPMAKIKLMKLQRQRQQEQLRTRIASVKTTVGSSISKSERSSDNGNLDRLKKRSRDGDDYEYREHSSRRQRSDGRDKYTSHETDKYGRDRHKSERHHSRDHSRDSHSSRHRHSHSHNHSRHSDDCSHVKLHHSSSSNKEHSSHTNYSRPKDPSSHRENRDCTSYGDHDLCTKNKD